MTYTPGPDDLDEMPMPDEWKAIADKVLPNNRERVAEMASSGGGNAYGIKTDIPGFLTNAGLRPLFSPVVEDRLLAWKIRNQYVATPLFPRRLIIDA